MAQKKALRKPPTTQQRPDNDNPDTDEVDEEELATPPSDDDSTSDVETTPDDEDDETEPPAPEPVAEEPERLLGAPRDGKTFRPGEKVIVKGKEQGGFIVVQEPVYRAAKTPMSSRWRYHLLFSRGAEIPKGRCKEVKSEPGTFETDANI